MILLTGITSPACYGVDKTRELVIDLRQLPTSSQITIKAQVVEYVERYKFLGTQVDKKLSLKCNTDMLYRNGQQYLIDILTGHSVGTLALSHLQKIVDMSSKILS